MGNNLDKNKPLSILFLCRKYYFLHKMSRVRFHAIQAIGKVCKVVWSGPEWENWDEALTSKENINNLYKETPLPDMILCYKLDEIPGIGEIGLPCAVNRDELDTDDNTVSESIRKFSQYKIDLVISHQLRQMENPLLKALPCHFAYIPYCADDSIFRDYGETKTIDVMLIGNLGKSRYPLRAKLYTYLLTMQSDVRFKNFKLSVYPHPGYRLKTAQNNAHVIDFAKLINASKICLTCSGKYHLKYAKYVEVPACRTLLMADMPHEDQGILSEYLAEISENITYEELATKLLYYLQNEEERMRLTERGYSIVKNNFTQERYARDFVAVVEDYLKKYHHRKIWK